MYKVSDKIKFFRNIRKDLIAGQKYDYSYYNSETKKRASLLASRRQRAGFIINQTNNDSTMDDNSFGPYDK